MVEIEKLQEKLGEALGLEIAAQKAVEELGSKGLLDENGMITQLKKAGVWLMEAVNLIQQKHNKLHKRQLKSVQA